MIQCNTFWWMVSPSRIITVAERWGQLLWTESAQLKATRQMRVNITRRIFINCLPSAAFWSLAWEGSPSPDLESWAALLDSALSWMCRSGLEGCSRWSWESGGREGGEQMVSFPSCLLARGYSKKHCCWEGSRLHHWQPRRWPETPSTYFFSVSIDLCSLFVKTWWLAAGWWECQSPQPNMLTNQERKSVPDAGNFKKSHRTPFWGSLAGARHRKEMWSGGRALPPIAVWPMRKGGVGTRLHASSCPK